MTEQFESEMEELGPFEIEHMRKKLKKGQFSLPLLSTPKLVFKLSSQDSVEYFPCLLDMIRLWGCKVIKSMVLLNGCSLLDVSDGT